MRAFGAKEADIAAFRKRALKQREKETVEVYDDCLESVLLFEAMQTQWQRAGLAGVQTGLNYQSLDPVAKMLGIEIVRQRFQDIRVMEAEALKVFARNKKTTGKRNGSNRSTPKKSSRRGSVRRPSRPRSPRRGGGRR